MADHWAWANGPNNQLLGLGQWLRISRLNLISWAIYYGSCPLICKKEVEQKIWIAFNCFRAVFGRFLGRLGLVGPPEPNGSLDVP